MAADSEQSNASTTYSDELIEAGRASFSANCAFCHGRDAAGGSKGLDLIRSELVAQDINGDKIEPVVRQGRIEKEMPAFTGINQSDLDAIVAFIHNQKRLAESADGGRRSVQPEDLAVGDAGQGEKYFAAHCSSCHSATGDLAGIGLRLQGLPLLMRMLYPGSERRGASSPPASVSVTTGDGDKFQGSLAYRDEFTIALTDAGGIYRSWSTKNIKFEIDDPLQAHVKQLNRYTDKDMHDVYAYLSTLH